MKLVLPDKNYRYRHPSQLPALFRNENGAIDLASIMVGVIVIGLIGGVIAATIFAVIPWAQDAAAKHQLDSITQAENAYYGFTAGNLSNLPSGAKANTYSSSPMIAESNFLEQAPNYCVVASADGKSYNSYSLSGTGRVWTTDNTNVPPTVYPGTLAQACPASYTSTTVSTSLVPTARVSLPGEFTSPQSVGPAQSDTKTLSFSLPKSYSNYTVVWTDTLNTMNGGGTGNNTSTLTDTNGQPYWSYTIAPGSGGWTAGTATVTATITDNTTKQTTAKIWSVITPNGASGSGDPMWNTVEAPIATFAHFGTSAANPNRLTVTFSTNGQNNQYNVGGSFIVASQITYYCQNAGGGNINGPYVATAAAGLSLPWGASNPGPNSGTATVADCQVGQVPYSASGQVPTENWWENYSNGSKGYVTGLLTPIDNTTSFVAGP